MLHCNKLQRRNKKSRILTELHKQVVKTELVMGKVAVCLAEVGRQDQKTILAEGIPQIFHRIQDFI